MSMISTREAYGRKLCELGANENIFVLDADLTICTMSCYFAEQYPERFFNAGIAEANMIAMAAGMAASGKTVFCHSFAMFTAGRGYDQIRNSVAYPRLNVKIVGTHAGLSVGEDGATHQCIEDLALMRAVPGMTVICPCDANETREAAAAMAAYDGPCYLRLGRSPVKSVTDTLPGYRFELGKGIVLRDGADAAIVATGLMVQAALEAAELLAAEGIEARVIDIHTLKPLDRELIVKAARETGAVVSAEEHNIIGGLGSAVAEVLAEEQCGAAFARLGVADMFGHSGTAEALMERYGLTAADLAGKVKQVVSRKQAGK